MTPYQKALHDYLMGPAHHDTSHALRKTVRINQHIHPDTLDAIVDTYPVNVDEDIMTNKKTSSHTIRKMLHGQPKGVLADELITHPNTPPELLDGLKDHFRKVIRLGVLKHPNTSEETRKYIQKHG